jgi:hypothetical protein
MLPIPESPEPTRSTLPVARHARRVAHAIRHRNWESALSWLVWLVAVGAFAIWTFAHYRTPAGPAWIGMLIRTTVFAIWTLVAREWFTVRVERRRRQRRKLHDRAPE